MTFADSTLRWQRWVLAAMLFGSAVLMVPGGLLTEPFMLPKITFMLACALGLVGLWAARAAWSRQTALPQGPTAVAAGLFVLALVVTTVLSPSPWASVVGYYSRYTGLVPYLVHLVAFVAVLRLTDLRYARALMRTGVVALTVVAGYGLVQALGLDPVQYSDLSLGRTFSTMGNTNFGGAWAGAVLGLALATALDGSEERGWRVYAAVLTPLALLYALVTGTAQGVVVSAVALTTTAAISLSDREAGARRWALAHRPAAAAVAAAVVVLAAVGAVAARSTIRAQLEQSLVERPEFWSAALGVWRDNPVVGTGLDTFAHHFLAYRPASHALANGTATTDAPHSVPLGMLSNGGLVLFLPWLAFVLAVAVVLVLGLRRVHGPERLVLAGFAGVWAGYQVQALVSFDMPPLALLHFLSAGVIVALAAPPRWRSVRLPGVAAERAINKRGKPVGPVVVPASTRILHGATALLLLVLLWFGLYPLRADRAAASAAPLTASGQLDEASVRFASAADLNPAEARYLFIDAQVHAEAGRGEQALASAEEAARRDPGPVEYVLFAARQADALGQHELALTYFEDALARDPRDPPVLNEVAVEYLEREQPAKAEELLSRSVDLRPDAESLVLLGQSRQVQQDVAGAREAFERALQIAPDDEAARQALAALPA